MRPLSKENIEILPYSPSDSIAVNQLFLELQRYEHKFDANKSTELENAQKYQEKLLETIENQHGELLIAKINGKIVGLLGWYLEEELEFDKAYGYISDIVVTEAYRGKGIGQQLLDEALVRIKNTNVSRVHIGVLLKNIDTKKFYAKNGFSEYSVEMVKELN